MNTSTFFLSFYLAVCLFGLVVQGSHHHHVAREKGEAILEKVRHANCSYEGFDFSGLVAAKDYSYVSGKNIWNLNICANTNTLCDGTVPSPAVWNYAGGLNYACFALGNLNEAVWSSTCDGSVQLLYSGGDKCYTETPVKHYAVKIKFICDYSSLGRINKVDTDNGGKPSCTHVVQFFTKYAC